MKTAILAVALATGLAGCMSRESANVYSKQVVRMATVDSVRKVLIDGSQSGIGAAAGGVAGGVAGSGVGQGRGSAVVGVLGAVAGGVAGNVIEKKATTKDAFEILVRLDSGEMRAIVQEADVAFQPGQRVRLLTSGGVTRVTP
jgi:outer membrane lipoprotein SlyB